MGFRTVYGLNHSENGWRMIDAAGCTTAKIPGTGLSLPFRTGDAQIVLTAWAAWFNANVESLNNPGRGYADEGSFTWTNSVASSNHLSGTAMDLNWNDHAFRVSYSGFTSAEIAAVRRGLALFNKCIWWGQDWTSPKDSMHFQLNFPEATRAAETALLFLQFIMRSLRPLGRVGMVVPNGTLFADGVAARIKGQLLADFNLHTIVRLPNGVFAPYTSIPTNLLFFDRTGPTGDIWYYEHPLPEGRKNYTKTKPLTYEEFAPLLAWWDERVENERAWRVPAADLIRRDEKGNVVAVNLDRKNPNAAEDLEHMAPEELVASIIRKEHQILGLMDEIAAELSR